MTMAILFMNIFLTLMYPNLVLGGNNLYEKSINGNYKLDNELQDSLGNIANQEGGLPILGDFFDAIFLLYDFVKALISIFFSSIVILFSLEGVWTLLLSVPIGIAYLLAILGWIYR